MTKELKAKAYDLVVEINDLVKAYEANELHKIYNEQLSALNKKLNELQAKIVEKGDV